MTTAASEEDTAQLLRVAYEDWKYGALSSAQLALLQVQSPPPGLRWWQRHEQAAGIATPSDNPNQLPAFVPNATAFSLKVSGSSDRRSQTTRPTIDPQTRCVE
jgi:hypothetical protein